MLEIAKQPTIPEAKKQLMLMFRGFPLFGDEAELKLEFDAYWESMQDLPVGIIVAACRAGARGKIRCDGKRPTSADLYRYAEALIRRLPKPLSESEYGERQFQEDEQKRVAEQFRELAASMKSGAYNNSGMPHIGESLRSSLEKISNAHDA
jgi:hypothetical protein